MPEEWATASNFLLASPVTYLVITTTADIALSPWSNSLATGIQDTSAVCKVILNMFCYGVDLKSDQVLMPTVPHASRIR